MNNLVPGIHTVTVTDHGVTTTKKGDPCVFAVFSNGAKWTGYLSEKAKPYTIKNLVTLGFAGNDLKELNYPGAIDSKHQVSITMENETWKNDSGEEVVTCKVRWINKMPQKLSDKEAATVLDGMNLKALFAEERKDQGVEHKKTDKPATPLKGASLTADDIPF